MSNTQDLYRLLQQRDGQWVSRADLQFVGGIDTGRRMRELMVQLSSTTGQRLESRESDDPGRPLEYRLVRLSPVETEAEAERYQWECIVCTAHPSDFSRTQPSIDPRWRRGPCHACRSKMVTFQKVTR